MKEKFQNFKNKYLTLPWLTFGLCVAILLINVFKGPNRPHRGPVRSHEGASQVEVKP